jgi:hypothetical protein
MSRVLLFVQGSCKPWLHNDRVTCAWPTPKEYIEHPHRLAKHIKAWRPREDRLAQSSFRKAVYAARWWLVECENAQQGRSFIACAAHACTNAEDCCQAHILASGVRGAERGDRT